MENAARDAAAVRWRTALPALAASLMLAVVLFRQTATSMAGIWARSDTFTHGFLVAPISAWLIWRLRGQLALAAPRPDARTIAPLSSACFTWLLGQLATVGVVAQFAFVTALILIVPAILGWRVAYRLAFPLLFLYFSVPFGEFAMPKLMDWTAEFTVIGLRMSGVPVFHEGLQFVIPSGRWSVVEACSGVRYLIASLSVGMLFAYLNYRSLKRRLVFIAVSIAVPILANWLRAYLIVMLGHWSGNTLASGVDHLIYGWFFFGIVIFLMFVIGGRWSDAGGPESRDAAWKAPEVLERSGIGFWKMAGVVMLVMASAPLGEWILLQRTAAAAPVFPDMRRLEDGWQATGKRLDPEWTPAYANPSAELNLVYSARGRTVGLYVGYYRQQNYERKLVSSENVLARSKDPVWARVASGTAKMRVAGRPVRARSAELRAGGVDGELQRLVAREFFWIDGRLTASGVEAKLLTALALLKGRGDDSAVVILYAPKEQPGGGDAALAAFAAANSARLLEALDTVRAQR
jgi:exosortase A